MNITLTIAYDSSLGTSMEDFIRSKKLQGYDYDGSAEILKVFDRFLVHKSFRSQRISREILEDYIAESRQAGLHANALYQRVLSVSQFSRYLAQSDPESYAIEKMPVSQVPNRPPYLYSRNEIHQLLEAAKELKPTPENPLRPHTYTTLLGLLYVSGLRLGEALSLSQEDVDCQRQRLFIRKGKFGKDRWVPISESTAEVLADYFSRRQKAACARGKQAVLFVDSKGKKLAQNTVRATFWRLLETCQISRNDTSQSNAKSQIRPRLHDLRHTFAVERLREAYQEGKDPNALLPVLATYMGHCKITGTQVYLHATEELRRETNKRFRQYAQEILPTSPHSLSKTQPL